MPMKKSGSLLLIHMSWEAHGQLDIIKGHHDYCKDICSVWKCFQTLKDVFTCVNRDRQLCFCLFVFCFLNCIADIPIGQPFLNVIMKIYLVGASSRELIKLFPPHSVFWHLSKMRAPTRE